MTSILFYYHQDLVYSTRRYRPTTVLTLGDVDEADKDATKLHRQTPEGDVCTFAEPSIP